eukprot:gene6782-9483_t
MDGVAAMLRPSPTIYTDIPAPTCLNLLLLSQQHVAHTYLYDLLQPVQSMTTHFQNPSTACSIMITPASIQLPSFKHQPSVLTASSFLNALLLSAYD